MGMSSASLAVFGYPEGEIPVLTEGLNTNFPHPTLEKTGEISDSKTELIELPYNHAIQSEYWRDPQRRP
jgi:hypothetical protein